MSSKCILVRRTFLSNLEAIRIDAKASFESLSISWEKKWNLHCGRSQVASLSAYCENRTFGSVLWSDRSGISLRVIRIAPKSGNHWSVQKRSNPNISIDEWMMKVCLILIWLLLFYSGIVDYGFIVDWQSMTAVVDGANTIFMTIYGSQTVSMLAWSTYE